MSNQLLQAAKHALEFIQSIDSYENSKTANELRQAIEAAEQCVRSDVCHECGAINAFEYDKERRGEVCVRCGTRR